MRAQKASVFVEIAVEERLAFCYQRKNVRPNAGPRFLGKKHLREGEAAMYNEMMDTIGLVNQADPELAAAMNRERNRQRENIELIASENIVSPAVMAAMGSIPTNKYAEGLPGCGGFLCRVFCAFLTNFCGRLCAEPNKTGANL